MILNEHVKIREEKFGAVIFETLREKVFVTNSTGKDILNLLEKDYPQEKIIEVLADDYGLNPVDIKEDVFNFISQLKENKIIKVITQ
ncbi:MAG: PqqD family protein [Candidatus Omnitrophota bacterium]|nr:PqqD family protein [Candidatus Omnitrophota bacterium]